jgi:CBS-domain-containing membrane protein
MPATAKPFHALLAKDLMNTEVATIPHELGMQTAARWLAQRRVSGAPVVDEQGRCVGVLSSNDFVACCAANRSRCSQHRVEAKCGACAFPDCVGTEWQIVNAAESVEGLVREYMTPDPVTAQPETPIARLAGMMRDAHVHRIIIVDEQWRPLGIVSTTDIVAAVARAEQDDGLIHQ